MKREIILGYDPEHGGDDVLRLGRVFAEVLASKPLVVTAIPWPDYLIGAADIDKELGAEMHDRFAVVEEEMRDLGVETLRTGQSHARRSSPGDRRERRRADDRRRFVSPGTGWSDAGRQRW